MPHCCGLPGRTGASHCGDCHTEAPACVKYRFGLLNVVTLSDGRQRWPAGQAGVLLKPQSSLRAAGSEADTCGGVAAAGGARQRREAR